MTEHIDDDPLSALLLDAAEVDRARLASGLKNLVGIDKASGRIVPRPEFRDLNNRGRLTAVLLAVKAAALMGISDEAIAAGDLAKLAGVVPGSAYPSLKTMREDRNVSQTESGEYYLNDHDVIEAIVYVEGLRTGDGSTPPRQTSEEVNKTNTAERSVRSSKPVDQNATGASDDGGHKSTPRATRGSFSVKGALVSLIESGWFDQPRTIADMKNHLSVTRARNVKSTSLSPILVALVRDGTLRREKNQDALFAYLKA